MKFAWDLDELVLISAKVLSWPVYLDWWDWR